VNQSNRTTLRFNARTEYERTAWLSVLGQLQYPSTSKRSGLKPYRHRSDKDLSLNSISMTTDSPISNRSNQMDEESVSFVVSLTQSQGSNDNNYLYNYHESTLYGHRGNGGHDERVTILGLLSDGMKGH